MRILILDFRNAGWFHKETYEYNKRDVVSDIDGRRQRSEFNKQYKEPITVHHVSNMLHVLFGERPSASLRKTYIQPIREIKEMAEKGWIKISDYSITNEKGKKTLFQEKLRTKKSAWNSWSKSNTLLYWERIKNFLEDELYNEFISLLKKIYQVEDPTIETLENVLTHVHNNMLDNPDVKEFMKKLIKNGKTPLYNVLTSGNIKNSEFNQYKSTVSNIAFKVGMTINSGITDFIRLSGQIIIPIEDEKWIDKLKDFQGVANILDGGIVKINKIIPEYEFSLDYVIGFEEIKNISDELLNI